MMLRRLMGLWSDGKADGARLEIDGRRNRQKNLKASPACIAAFAHLADVLEMSEAALFEDMVAARWEELRRSGRIK